MENIIASYGEKIVYYLSKEGTPWNKNVPYHFV